MPRPVYSKQFILAPALSGPVSYVVPAGYEAVIREFDCSIGPTTGEAAELVVSDALLVIFNTGFTDNFTSYQWRGRVVVPSGGAFSVTTTGVWSVYCGGYLLSLP